jgi:DsbC/DsbD-like thiol-disulfide interchange protein
MRHPFFTSGFILLTAAAADGQILSSGFDQSAAKVDIVQGWAEADGSYYAGLRITLAPGWKTYWRAPGWNGIAPQFDWTGSRNLGAVEVYWPSPRLIPSYGSDVLGYENMVVLPLRIAPTETGSPVDLALELSFGVCSDVCIPETAQVTAEIGAGTDREREMIAAALKARPKTSDEAGIERLDCDITRSGDTFEMASVLQFQAGLDDVDAVVVEPGTDLAWVSDIEIEQQDDRVQTTSKIEYFGEQDWSPEPTTIRMTLIGEAGAIDVRGCLKG